MERYSLRRPLTKYGAILALAAGIVWSAAQGATLRSTDYEVVTGDVLENWGGAASADYQSQAATLLLGAQGGLHGSADYTVVPVYAPANAAGTTLSSVELWQLYD